MDGLHSDATVMQMDITQTEKKGNSIVRAYSNVSQQMLTQPINNTGLGFKRQGLCIFIRSRNLWDFALTEKKKKQNQKISLGAWRKVNASLLPYCS